MDSLPPRILRFRLRLARFHYTIKHIPGKLMYRADTLSRAPISDTGDTELEEGAEALIEMSISQIPANTSKLEEYRSSQASDPVCSQVRSYCTDGWPNKNSVETALIPYWKVRSELTVGSDLLLFRRRIVVSKTPQKPTLEKNPCRPPRHIKVPNKSQIFCLVARPLCASQRHREAVYHLCKRFHQSK